VVARRAHHLRLAEDGVVVTVTAHTRSVVVWGNCQAEPVAALLSAPLAERGLKVELVAPVFLADAGEVARVQQLVAGSAFLLSQPIGDNYGVPGCSTAHLASLLPADGRLITFPVTFHVGPFPYQVNAHGGDGVRVNAPLTDYHDLRAVVAAERGLSLDEALTWWPEPSAVAVQESSARSLAELRRRETTLDVTTSSLLDRPDAMMTISHPSNVVLAGVAEELLRAMALTGTLDVPVREFLGQRRAPREVAVLSALGWPADAVRPHWLIDGAQVEPSIVVGAHLGFYRERPDVVIDCRARYAEKLNLLGL
jgi:Polysaccharide biosynthesis enzyme WcbI